MTRRPQPYLVAAVTGRALAASALRAGARVVVLDCFADRDTRRLAARCRNVASRKALRLDPGALLAAAQRLAPGAPLVYGAGFEGQVDLLSRLLRHRALFGNPPETVALVRDPHRFFPLLQRIRIETPEVRYAAPRALGGWLVKQAGGAGGAHVRYASSRRLAPGCYLQRYERGRTLSALFLANGRRACLLGVNRQWNVRVRPGRPFLYGGAIGGATIPAVLRRQLGERLDQLVAAIGLVGLNGLDFLHQDERWLALELNPRPTATMELYDRDYPRGLFAWHLRACRGELPPAAAAPRATRAHAIIFAEAPVRVGPRARFPTWCRDVPMPGTRLRAGDPVCTVHASAGSAAETIALLRERQARLRRRLRRDAA